MFNYIRSEFYRILHKKSFFIYYGVLAAAFILLMIISGATGVTGLELLQFSGLLLNMSMLVVGVQVFVTVYNDEISSHTLPGLIGQGLSRTSIILSKIVVMAVTTIAAYAWLGLIYFGYYLISNQGIVAGDMEILMRILRMALSTILSIIGFSSITSIVAYGQQKTAISVTFLVLLMTNFFAQIIGLITSIGVIKSLVGDVSQYTFSVASTNLFTSLTMANLNTSALMQMGLWIVGSIILAAIVFKKKELEF